MEVAKEIIIPQFGTSAETVKFLKWCKQVGDTVQRGDIICEIETDKAASELESFVEGTLLKQMVQPEDEIPIGTVIAYVGEPGEELPQ